MRCSGQELRPVSQSLIGRVGRRGGLSAPPMAKVFFVFTVVRIIVCAIVRESVLLWYGATCLKWNKPGKIEAYFCTHVFGCLFFWE